MILKIKNNNNYPPFFEVFYQKDQRIFLITFEVKEDYTIDRKSVRVSSFDNDINLDRESIKDILTEIKKENLKEIKPFESFKSKEKEINVKEMAKTIFNEYNEMNYENGAEYEYKAESISSAGEFQNFLTILLNNFSKATVKGLELSDYPDEWVSLENYETDIELFQQTLYRRVVEEFKEDINDPISKVSVSLKKTKHFLTNLTDAYISKGQEIKSQTLKEILNGN
jgi:hypothetical protein